MCKSCKFASGHAIFQLTFNCKDIREENTKGRSVGNKLSRRRGVDLKAGM